MADVEREVIVIRIGGRSVDRIISGGEIQRDKAGQFAAQERANRKGVDVTIAPGSERGGIRGFKPGVHRRREGERCGCTCTQRTSESSRSTVAATQINTVAVIDACAQDQSGKIPIDKNARGIRQLIQVTQTRHGRVLRRVLDNAEKVVDPDEKIPYEDLEIDIGARTDRGIKLLLTGCAPNHLG